MVDFHCFANFMSFLQGRGMQNYLKHVTFQQKRKKPGTFILFSWFTISNYKYAFLSLHERYIASVLCHDCIEAVLSILHTMSSFLLEIPSMGDVFFLRLVYVIKTVTNQTSYRPSYEKRKRYNIWWARSPGNLTASSNPGWRKLLSPHCLTWKL